MLYSDEFIESIPDKPVEMILEICKSPIEYLGNCGSFDGYIVDENGYHDLIESYSLVQTIFDENILDPVCDPLSLSGIAGKDAGILHDYFLIIQKYFLTQGTQLKIQDLSLKFKNKLNQGFVYEFTQGDVDRIQILINELRTEISKSKLVSSDHKSRLLKRLEKLQAEIHKKMSDLDRFWGLIGDAGIVLGKFGEDAKPFVDRIKEIADIVWRTQSKAEELPTGIQNPMIPHSADCV